MHRGSVQSSKKYVVWGIIAFVLVLAVETADYLITVPKIEIDEEWTNNIKAKCEKADISEAYSSKSEIQNGIIGIGFGAYFGMIYFAKKNPYPGKP